MAEWSRFLPVVVGIFASCELYCMRRVYYVFICLSNERVLLVVWGGMFRRWSYPYGVGATGQRLQGKGDVV